MKAKVQLITRAGVRADPEIIPVPSWEQGQHAAIMEWSHMRLPSHLAAAADLDRIAVEIYLDEQDPATEEPVDSYDIEI